MFETAAINTLGSDCIEFMGLYTLSTSDNFCRCVFPGMRVLQMVFEPATVNTLGSDCIEFMGLIL